MAGDFLGQFSGGGSREGKELDPWRVGESEQPLEKRYECKALSGSRAGEHSGVLLRIVIDEILLLVSRSGSGQWVHLSCARRRTRS